MPPRILLIGMMGSGKSTVGRLLAQRLSVAFHDNDAHLRRRATAAGRAPGGTVGTDALHAAETAALHDVLRQTAGSGAVISAAASAALDAETRATLGRSGTVVWLRASPEMLVSRLAADGSTWRPKARDDMPTWLRDQATARAPLYADVARLTVDVDGLAPWQVTQRVLDGLGLGAFGWLPGSFQGVVLDLDGLLVDTEVIWTEAKRVLYAERGVPFSIEDHRAVLGTSEEYTAMVFTRRFGLTPDHEPEILHAYLRHATALFAQGVPRRPGALELVTSLRGRVPLGLASNTRREIVTQTLAQSGLSGCFDAIVTGDEAEPKPAAGIYLEACRQLGIDPGRSVAVEDSPIGVRAAKAAGLTCIGVPSDPDNPVPQADHSVASLLDLIEPAG